MTGTKQYLGDSVYAEITDGELILTTENGYEASNTIIIDSQVWLALVNYVASTLRKLNEEAGE